jgi:hypothetical protein
LGFLPTLPADWDLSLLLKIKAGSNLYDGFINIRKDESDAV